MKDCRTECWWMLPAPTRNLRRYPEIRWRFRSEDLKALTRIQKAVLKSGLELLKPGGMLVWFVQTRN